MNAESHRRKYRLWRWHSLAVRQIAVAWEQSLDNDDGVTVSVRLPALGRSLTDLDREDLSSLALLVTWQHPELELEAKAMNGRVVAFRVNFSAGGV